MFLHPYSFLKLSSYGRRSSFFNYFFTVICLTLVTQGGEAPICLLPLVDEILPAECDKGSATLDVKSLSTICYHITIAKLVNSPIDFSISPYSLQKIGSIKFQLCMWVWTSLTPNRSWSSILHQGKTGILRHLTRLPPSCAFATFAWAIWTR